MRSQYFLSPVIAAALGLAPLAAADGPVQVERVEADRLQQVYDDRTTVIDLATDRDAEGINVEAKTWSDIYADNSLEGDLENTDKIVLIATERDQEAVADFARAIQEQDQDYQVYLFRGDHEAFNQALGDQPQARAWGQRDSDQGEDLVATDDAEGTDRTSHERGQSFNDGDGDRAVKQQAERSPKATDEQDEPFRGVGPLSHRTPDRPKTDNVDGGGDVEVATDDSVFDNHSYEDDAADDTTASVDADATMGADGFDDSIEGDVASDQSVFENRSHEGDAADDAAGVDQDATADADDWDQGEFENDERDPLTRRTSDQPEADEGM